MIFYVNLLSEVVWEDKSSVFTKFEQSTLKDIPVYDNRCSCMGAVKRWKVRYLYLTVSPI